MNAFQIGDIVVGNNSWLNSMIGSGGLPGVLIHIGTYSSIIHLFTKNQDITLLNDYIEKIEMSEEELKIKIITKHWEFICTYYPNEIDGDAEDFFKQIFK